MDPRSNNNRADVSPALVVMAAGIGSRYGGLKQVDPVGPGGEMILDYSVYDALRAGFGKVVFVIRRDIESDFRDTIGRRIEPHIDTAYVFQELTALPAGFSVPHGRAKPWGTGHAVLCARDEIEGPFAAINADDFYGAGAFALVGEHLGRGRAGGDDHAGAVANESVGGLPGAPDEYSMAGYRLSNTLSEHGNVSRGVCEVTSDGFLERVVERTTVRRFPDGMKYEEADGDWTRLPDDSVVSMNIWGFTESFLDRLDEAFRAFLESRGDTEGAELYLPAVVNDLIRSGAVRVRVLPTDERWFGMTYREDRPTAERAILDRVERGVYPRSLWK